MKKKRILSILSQSHFLVVTGLCIYLTSCAPVFSELQSARTVGKNNIELTPSFSSVTFVLNEDENMESDHVQNHVGLQAAYGISESVDLRMRYEYIWLDEDGFKTSVIGMGPKFSLVKDRIAAYIPIGFAFGDDLTFEDSWEIHPTLLGTVPVTFFLEVNPSFKYLILPQKDSDNLMAFNIGLGLSNNFEKWVFRPEFGLLYNPGEDGHFYHFSVGISVRPFNN